MATLRAIAVFSGGLDSILAARVIQEQGIDVRGITFETPFFSAEKAKATAARISLPLTVVDITEEHLRMLHAPRYGYGRNMNPCIDCHTLMIRLAGQRMEDAGADFILTGEVLGQRPMSQGRQALAIVAKNAGYPDLLVRPLSARLLPPTALEREGRIDRSRLLDIQGRGRKRQMALAGRYGITAYPAPAGGCLLTDPGFAGRLRDLFNHHPGHEIRDIELLKVGRHFRLNETTKAVVGRNAADNDIIEHVGTTGDTLLRIADFPGPTVLIPGGGDARTRLLAARICVRYSDAPRDRPVTVSCVSKGLTTSLTVPALAPAETAGFII